MATPARKKPRKSRSRGLRTNTGCLTCRKRHKKCDEQVPICGSCQLANRTCIYGEPSRAGSGLKSRASGPLSPGRPSRTAQQDPQQVLDQPASFGHTIEDIPYNGQDSSFLRDGSIIRSGNGGSRGCESRPLSVPSSHSILHRALSPPRLPRSPTNGRPNMAHGTTIVSTGIPPRIPTVDAPQQHFTSHSGLDESTQVGASPAAHSQYPARGTPNGAASSGGSYLAADHNNAIATNALSPEVAAAAAAAFVSSPGNLSIASDILLTAGGASIGWLDLLASDAAHADASFSLMPVESLDAAQRFDARRVSLSARGHPLGHGLDGDDTVAAEQQLSEENARLNQRHYLQQQYQLYLEQQQQYQQQQQNQSLNEQLHASLQHPQQLPTDGDKHPWQEEEDIALQEHERILFRSFVQHAALWLDFLDSDKHFSTYVIRLALRNTGLMKAVLALSSRHTAMSQGTPAASPRSQTPTRQRNSQQSHHSPVTSVAAGVTSPHQQRHRRHRSPDVHAQHAQAIQYYYETLHYLQHALQFPSYTMSEEILATAIIISTYEMLDQSASNWQRHLKGVFWIQRSQDVNGASGGLRQAVWWAWLRQDLWAAFREKRSCFSFWKPVRELAELRGRNDELADRAVYLLSQAVNYAAEAQAANVSPAAAAAAEYNDNEASSGAAAQRPSADQQSRQRYAGKNLLAALERWRSYLGPQFQPLPTPRTRTAFDETMGRQEENGSAEQPSSCENASPFTPIWIHPPRYAVAVMVYNFAKILVTLHCPTEPGFAQYLKIQKTLSESVAAICGIAMMLEDEGCQIMASHCLYGAGLCVQQPVERATILDLISACERRTGWPMSTMRNDLQAEWQRVDKEVG